MSARFSSVPSQTSRKPQSLSLPHKKGDKSLTSSLINVKTSESDFDIMFDLNAKVAFLFIKHAAINLEDGGKIVSTVTSLLAAFTGHYALYAGAKAPVEHFTRAA